MEIRFLLLWVRKRKSVTKWRPCFSPFSYCMERGFLLFWVVVYNSSNGPISTLEAGLIFLAYKPVNINFLKKK